MGSVISLRIREDRDAWRVAIGDGRTRPAEAVVPPEAVSAAIATIQAELSEVPALVVRGRDAQRTRGEEHAGRALGQLLWSSSELSSKLAYLLGEARGRSETALVVLDAVDARVRDLPWELLAVAPDAPPLETTAAGLVGRLVQGFSDRRPTGPSDALTLTHWCPDPDDPVCQARLQALDSMAAALGLPAASALETEAPAVPLPVLHVVCHGRAVHDQVSLIIGDGERGAGTAAHLLLPHLQAASLVVLDVCEAGDVTTHEVDSLAGRFVACGARACVAPRARTSTDAAQAFSSGLYRAIMSGEPIVAAVAAGRREVSALASAHPDSRWCNHVLHLSDISLAEAKPLIRTSWRPEGWQPPSAEVARLLETAERRATGEETGFVGLEHLLDAFLQGGKGPTATRIRYALARHVDALSAHLTGLAVRPECAPDTRGSPRLQRYALRLAAGADVESLATVIVSDPTSFVRELLFAAAAAPATAATLQPQTPPSRSATGPTAPADGLEVLGGPEDGLQLRPTSRTTIGRWTAGETAESALYVDTRLTDPYLSRQHLIWLGGGRVELQRGATLIRGGTVLPVKGEVAVCVDDILQLTGSTRLRGII